MLINIALEGIELSTVISIIKKLSEQEKPIVLSITSSKDSIADRMFIQELVRELNENKINFTLGPIFLKEDLILGDKIISIEALYVTTNGEKVMWYLKNGNVSYEIDTVVLIDRDLGIDPLLIKQKTKYLDREYKYYFVYSESELKNIESLVNGEQFEFKRIKRR